MTEAYLRKGRLLETQQHFEHAANTYHTALRFNADPRVRARLGFVLGVSGELAGAELEFQQAHDEGARGLEFFHNWGTVGLRRSDWSAAVERFQQALMFEPGAADTLYNLGLALEGQGQPAEAKEAYRRAVELAPENPARERLGELEALH